MNAVFLIIVYGGRLGEIFCSWRDILLNREIELSVKINSCDFKEKLQITEFFKHCRFFKLGLYAKLIYSIYKETHLANGGSNEILYL